MDALQRLVDGTPENKKLKASVKAGKLKINVSNVAIEARRARTLIALEDCRYPKVREAIQIAQDGKSKVPSTYTQLIQNLRTDLAQAKAENKLLQTQITAHFIARKTAEEEARRATAIAANLRREITELHKTVSLPAKAPKELPRLILIRGLPGSGKTSMGKTYKDQGYKHVEADMFFEIDSKYQFEESKLPEAHAWCLQQAHDALAVGGHVVVANVFATVEEIKPYIDLGFDYQIIEATGRGKSIHPIPSAVLKRMKAAWVPTDALLAQLKGKAPSCSQVASIHSAKKNRK
ncbi:hypothetical protein F8A87_06710 [Betaproteobacteria bacterium SCN2]|jgi:hypothetical protein|nr:hypothetical protein F8A87_06710 [Betaproteobacteria bacterium SCN2]